MIPDSTPIGVGQYVERLDAPNDSALTGADIAARRACDDALPDGSFPRYFDATTTTLTFDDTFFIPPPLGTDNNFPRSVKKRLDINLTLAIRIKSAGNSSPGILRRTCAHGAPPARFASRCWAVPRRFPRPDAPRHTKFVDFCRIGRWRHERSWAPTQNIGKRYHGIDGLRGPPGLYAVLEMRAVIRLDSTARPTVVKWVNSSRPAAALKRKVPFPSSGAAAFREGGMIEVGERNRMFAYPHPLRQVARDQVNPRAALLLTSGSTARTLGIPEHWWIYLHGYRQIEG